MIIKIIPEKGIGHGQALVLPVSQIVVELDNGTPIFAAAHYGPDGAYAASMVGMKDFKRILQTLGIETTVIVDKIKMPEPPPGARLIAGPDVS